MKTIERTSVADMVVDNLREQILSGEFEIGDKFYPEQKICQELNVSRASVREAIRVLQVMGFLDLQPGRGAFVARTSEPEKHEIIQWIQEHEVRFKDVMETRTLLETFAIRQAIHRCTDEDIEAIEQIHKQFEKAVRKKDIASMISYDEEFHFQIFRTTHNQVLCSIYDQLRQFINDFRSRSFALDELYNNALEPHARIITAFKKRDEELGMKMMQEHMDITRKDMLSVSK